MPSKKSKAVPADVASFVKENAYIQRLINDEQLRDNFRHAYDSGRSAYARISNGKQPTQAVLKDKRLQRDIRDAFEAIREATNALQEGQKPRRKVTFGRVVMFAGVGSGVAMVASEKLRSKVLDTLFGAEEEFQYTPPTGTTPATPPSSSSSPTTPVSTT